MIPSASLHLLKQDNSIPGNRKDGFRYHHLLFIIVLTPLYLWLELSFGVRLLDNISGSVIPEDIAAIEHWGRLISGCAVALLFLSGWVQQCEKYNIHWAGRIVIGIAISIACIAFTWWAQGKVIDFYINRTNREITIALSLLLGMVVAGLFIIRAWIRYAVRDRNCGYWRLIGGLVVILGVGYVLMAAIPKLLPNDPERLGFERQRAATLTLIRRAVQEGIYGLPNVEPEIRTLQSAEGKTFLALFPIFGTTFNYDRFEHDRPELLRELIYRDWDQQYGGQSFSAFADAGEELRHIHQDIYQKASSQLARETSSLGNKLAQQNFANTMAPVMEGELPTANLKLDSFIDSRAGRRFVGKRLGCLDCAFTARMNRESFGRELFKWTQANTVRQAIETFDSAKHFETGHDGERAARTYWVPIWALLFSMTGAFTHIFKIIFTLTEYAHRMTFNDVKAADSPLADRVIRNSRIVTAGVVLAMGLFIYFSDNRVTSHERYVELRSVMWRQSPIVGGIAAHWTLNAQGLVYPFTRKIRPSWLTFDNDPLSGVPLLADWVRTEY